MPSSELLAPLLYPVFAADAGALVVRHVRQSYPLPLHKNPSEVDKRLTICAQQPVPGAQHSTASAQTCRC